MAGAEAEPALRAMLERLYEDATSFDFPEERFERVYDELERTLYDGTARVVAVAPLRGARLETGGSIWAAASRWSAATRRTRRARRPGRIPSSAATARPSRAS